MSLATSDTMDVEEQAKAALLSHIRTSESGGHGKAGGYPPDFDPDDALDYIEIGNESEDHQRKINAAR